MRFLGYPRYVVYGIIYWDVRFVSLCPQSLSDLPGRVQVYRGYGPRPSTPVDRWGLKVVTSPDPRNSPTLLTLNLEGRRIPYDPVSTRPQRFRVVGGTGSTIDLSLLVPSLRPKRYLFRKGDWGRCLVSLLLCPKTRSQRGGPGVDGCVRGRLRGSEVPRGSHGRTVRTRT